MLYIYTFKYPYRLIGHWVCNCGPNSICFDYTRVPRFLMNNECIFFSPNNKGRVPYIQYVPLDERVLVEVPLRPRWLEKSPTFARDVTIEPSSPGIIYFWIIINVTRQLTDINLRPMVSVYVYTCDPSIGGARFVEINCIGITVYRNVYIPKKNVETSPRTNGRTNKTQVHLSRFCLPRPVSPEWLITPVDQYWPKFGNIYTLVRIYGIATIDFGTSK